MAREDTELQKLDDLLESFTKAMRKRLQEKYMVGWDAWHRALQKENFKKRLISNAIRGDMVDVANLAAFIWNIDNKRKKS